MARRRLNPSVPGRDPCADPVPGLSAEAAGADVPRAEHFAGPGAAAAPGPAPRPIPGSILGAALGSTPSGPPIARVAAEAAGQAALAEVVETLRRAQEEGRMVIEIPLDDVAADHLLRDRIAREENAAGGPGAAADEEMTALRESLRAHGQRMPIEVTPLRGPASDEGRDGGFARGRLPFGLISGWRRLAALRALHAETGDERFATIRALVRRPGNAAAAYVAMVEENEIRLGLSQYERARVAARAAERGVFPSEKAALLALFAGASRAKRSRIRAFVEIYHALDDALRFPTHLPERLGLRLVELLRAGAAPEIAAALDAAAPRDPEAELAVLEALVARLGGEPGTETETEGEAGPPDAGPGRGAGAEPEPGSERRAGWTWERIGPGLELGTREGASPEFRLRGPGVSPEIGALLRSALRRAGAGEG